MFRSEKRVFDERQGFNFFPAKVSVNLNYNVMAKYFQYPAKVFLQIPPLKSVLVRTS